MSFSAATGLDYFGARYFSAAQGRWTTPDWSATPQPIPYAKFDDPQTLNLYSYVHNNPLNRTDPDGHCCWDEIIAAYSYVKSVAYLKLEGGIGGGASARIGPVKAEVDFKRVSETKFAEPVSTKTSIIELAAKVDVGPARVGLAATGEQVTAKGDKILPNQEREWKFLPGFDLGGNGKGSGWDFGLGAQVGVGLQGGVEAGVNGQKILNDILPPQQNLWVDSGSGSRPKL